MNNKREAVALPVRRVPAILAVVAFLGLAVSGAVWAAAQEQTANASTQLARNPALPSLRICLRLADETPFLGTANVRVNPNEGYEIPGAPGEEKGDFLFPEVPPGKYFVEVSAPGYLGVRLSTELAAGGRERTVFVVMKPRAISRVTTTKRPMMASGAPVHTEAVVKKDPWRPHQLEEFVPRVDANVSCPTEDVVEGVGQRASEFVRTLEKFTATETVEHYPIDSSGARTGPERRSFAYVVTVTQSQEGAFVVDEFRNGGTDSEQFPGHVATNGLPAMSLVFHPALMGDFDFRCEGLGEWEGHEAWQIHFVQRENRPVRIRSYYVGGGLFPVYLEGRVWIDPGTDQVIRLESELAKPIPQIELKQEYLTVNYAAVKFASTGEQIWLPHEAELYVERNGKRFYRRHTFSDFKIFNVDTTQTMQAPKGSYKITNLTDQDVAGELTVIPAEGMKWEPVVLQLTVPANGRALVLVGPGKDVNLPVAAVTSARFVYKARLGSVKVEANLVNETTLDVLSEVELKE